MRYITKICSLAFLGAILWMPMTANAQGTPGNCDPALAEQYLDVNNVRARIPNNGELFYRNEPHVYNVPKTTSSNAIFASGIWLGGQVGGSLRVAATRYGPYEFWAGPLTDDGSAPDDCAPYDRSFKVSRSDIQAYEGGGAATPDMIDWPTGLGAPTIDANGNPIDLLDQQFASRMDRKIDLAAGERPAILGDQSIWWVMNDMGNTHNDSDAPQIGVEVHVLVFAFDVAGDIGNATFYKYKIFYKGNVPLENAYFSIFSDPDLGDAGDDYVGSDTTLGVGYVYNADNNDGSAEGYGEAPPAVGYDFFQGPIVPAPGDTATVSGVKVADYKNLKMTSFVYYNNGGANNGDPGTADQYYKYMQARWKDGRPVLFGGDGHELNTTSEETMFMYPGNPAEGEYWSEVNTDGNGAINSPADRRFVLTSGPFTINPQDVQEIVFGIPYGRGADNLDSVNAMKDADALAQAAFDVQFDLPSAPNRPEVTFTELDSKVVIEWSNKPTSNNFLESYYALDPFAPLDDPDYVFEGYRIWEFEENADLNGIVLQTFDVPNGVTQVIDGFPGQTTSIVLEGKDKGVQTYATIDGLTNYHTYHFGVQAFAYNEGSYPKIFGSPIVRFDATPRRSEDIISEKATEAAATTGESDFEVDAQAIGQGSVSIDVVNPAVVKEGATYTVEFYEMELAGKRTVISTSTINTDDLQGEIDDARKETRGAKFATSVGTTYDIKRDGVVLFNGSLGDAVAPQRPNVIVFDGLQFSVLGPEPGFVDFLVVQNASGPILSTGAAGFQGFPNSLENAGEGPGYGDTQQVQGGRWAFATRGQGSFDGFVDESILQRAGWGPIVPYDFEFRFTGTSLFYNYFVDDTILPVGVPFEVWNIGIATPDDPSDDYRMIIAPLDDGGAEDVWDLRVADHAGSGGDNDPLTDRFYVFNPADTSPGSVGYDTWAADAVANNYGYTDYLGGEVFGRLVFWNWNGGSVATYKAAGCDPDVYDPTCGTGNLLGPALPEEGTIFRVVTAKPNQPGDVFSFNTEGFGVQLADAATKQEQVAEIGMVPNPYKGLSIYERSQLIDEVRFTNLLSDETTVRIFTLNGSLIREMFKPAGTRNLTWNLTTDNNLPIASGLYLVHVDVKNVGEAVVKFAVVRKQTQLNTF